MHMYIVQHSGINQDTCVYGVLFNSKMIVLWLTYSAIPEIRSKLHWIKWDLLSGKFV